jgi:apolipoprotein N-acyltransferase
VLRAALTGISAVISSRGEVEQMLDVNRQGVLEATVGGRSDLTFYSRFSWLVPVFCWLLAAFAILRPAQHMGNGERR